MILATDGRLTVRPMSAAPTDYVLMAKWLSNPALLEFYEGRDQQFDLKRVKAEFGPRALGQDRVVPCIIEMNGIAVGYIQFYPLDDSERAEYGIAPGERAVGLDLFIGDPGRWGSGLGPRVLRAMIRFLIRERDATVVVVDPHVTNERAIRAYEKAGFVKTKLLPGHELHEGALRDCWLMAWRPAGPDDG